MKKEEETEEILVISNSRKEERSLASAYLFSGLRGNWKCTGKEERENSSAFTCECPLFSAKKRIFLRKERCDQRDHSRRTW